MEVCIVAVSLSSLGSKTMRRITLTSGTSWTVPTGVTYVNVTLIGGGGGGGGSQTPSNGWEGSGLIGAGGQVMSSTLSTTPGASITYAIGAGGSGAQGAGGTGGTTSFTGATSAVGGNGGRGVNQGDGAAGQQGLVSPNGGQAGRGQNGWSGGAGGSGAIFIEYWA